MQSNHLHLFDQVSKTVNYLSLPANRERMGLGASTPFGVYYDTEFAPVHADYLQKYVTWNDPTTRTPAATKAFMNAEKALKKAYRNMYTSLLKTNPLVSDEDLTDMELPPHPSGERHPSPIATDYPGFKILTNIIRRLTVVFFDNTNEARAKPPGQHGAEIRWVILDTPPVDVGELIHSSFDTRSPFTLDFEGHERGKTVYFALCWENTRGAKGPYSPIESAIIP
jgi:hypothetical protein